MSNLIVGVHRGGGVGGLWVGGWGPLTVGACRMWNRSLLPLHKEQQLIRTALKRQHGDVIINKNDHTTVCQV